MTILVPADETHSGNAVVTAARGKSEPDTDIMKEIKVGLAKRNCITIHLGGQSLIMDTRAVSAVIRRVR